MTTPRKCLRRDGTAYRLDSFLAANPDEELTIADVMAKFDVSKTAVHGAIELLGRLGRIERVDVLRRPAKGRAS